MENNQFDEQNSPEPETISMRRSAIPWHTPSAGGGRDTWSCVFHQAVIGSGILNIFCDPTAFTCNSPATLAYINAYGISAIDL